VWKKEEKVWVQKANSLHMLCMYVCVCIYVCIKIWIYVHLCMHIYIYVGMVSCMYSNMYISMYVIMYVCKSSYLGMTCRRPGHMRVYAFVFAKTHNAISPFYWRTIKARISISPLLVELIRHSSYDSSAPAQNPPLCPLTLTFLFSFFSFFPCLLINQLKI
jgi:hypothetical protein